MEKWTKILGYENYEVSNFGSVVSLERLDTIGRIIHRKVLKQWKKDGYYFVCLYGKGKFKHIQVHRLVAGGFIFNTENKPFVNHIDGIRSNNLVSNLEWCTQSENIQHAYDTGLRTPTSRRGLKNSKTKLTEEQVLEIRSSELKQKDLAKIYNVDPTNISSIKRYKSWTHI